MLAVVDTNVWVSAFLTPHGTAARLLEAVRAGRLLLAYSNDIETEYREVLSRPKFGFDPELIAAFLERLRAEGRCVNSLPSVFFPLPDLGDAPFVALAGYLGCPIVTGNSRHFPPLAGVEVLTPAKCVAKLMERYR